MRWVVLACWLGMVACDSGGDVVDPGRQDASESGGRVDAGQPRMDAAPISRDAEVDAARPAPDVGAIDARLPDASPPDMAGPCQPGSCPESQICGPDGVCVARCLPGGCPGGHCGPAGACVDGPCPEDVACAAGTFCSGAGQCVDGCRLQPDDCPGGFRCDPRTRDCVDCAAEEVCGNRIDDNCDGTVDEGCGCVAGEACETGLPGGCGAGRTVCVGGETRCEPPAGGLESCNGADDDCDGRVDESWPTLGQLCDGGAGLCAGRGHWACGPDGGDVVCAGFEAFAQEERCNGQDDDCDGRVDEAFADLGAVCSVGVGACAGEGRQRCTADGSAIECDARPSGPGGELCNGIDDDCDGLTDEPFPDVGTPCAVGVGVCASEGIRVCQNGGQTRCNAVAGRAVGEACNGLDDDCDGRTDEGPAGGRLTQRCYDGPAGTEGVSFCHGGASACENGIFGACEGQVLPEPERCDGEDNDCDGRVDRTPAGERLVEVCYGGPDGTGGVGDCRVGTAECRFGQLQACQGEVQPANEICDGGDNDCNGAADDVVGGCACQPGDVRECYAGPAGTAGVGICISGRQACLADGSAWSACAGAVLPTEEQCNGRDDDCNGVADDAVLGAGEACTDGTGACLARGTTACNGQEVLCDAVAGAPGVEVCNAADDDCDGRTDEQFDLGGACTAGVGACEAPGVRICTPEGGAACNAVPGRPVGETCNGLDDDCDGRADEDFQVGRGCSNGVGQCARVGRVVCAEDGQGICDAQPGAPAVEICNGADEDCDGRTDEVFDLGAACMAGVGACASAGVRICGPNGAVACDAPAIPPGIEACNGRDDDCDSRTDEGLANLGACNTGAAGICAAGRLQCAQGAPLCAAQAVAAEEVCDGLDNDCDGTLDEGLGVRDCGVGVCLHPVARCVNGAAGVCDPLAGSQAQELCNGLDDDCDGRIDEQAAGDGAACGAGVGACQRAGIRRCVAGALACNAVAGAPGAETCNATDDDCDGRTDEAIAPTACAAGVGTCLRNGQNTCQNGALRCDAVAGMGRVEQCDGADDDCDGRVDEGFGLQICGVGICQHPVQACDGGAPMGCDPLLGAQAETCNGQDDDCDGRTDEQVPGVGQACAAGMGQCQRAGQVQCQAGVLACNAVAGAPQAERCDGLDGDCDGRVDEQAVDAGGACSQGVGACLVQGALICNAGQLSCNAVPRVPGAETCNGIDDDCDGTVDDTPAGTGGACQAGTGECARGGVLVCQNAAIRCNAVPGNPAVEQCNGRDDDCDTRTDEATGGAACQEGVGACVVAGQLVCVGGVLDCNGNPRQPVAEVCNAFDDDCDGRADEASAGQSDCDLNGFRDDCDIAAGRAADCDGDGILNVCAIRQGAPDCNRNGIPDACDGGCPLDVQPPTVVLFLSTRTANPGQAIQVVVDAQDNVGVTACQLFVDAQPVALDQFCQAFVQLPTPGFHTFRGVARDAAGNQAEASDTVRVRDPNDAQCPVLAITAPPNGATIANATQVLGSVNDANLVEWRLSWGTVQNPEQTLVTRDVRTLNNALLGLLDPTVIPLGQHGLRLRAEDINGCISTLTGTFTVVNCQPQAELCDGADNDCDGRVDETFPGVGAACQVGLGACQRAGQVACLANGLAAECNVQAGAPTPERCDPIDQDCDGNPTNGFAVGQVCTVGLGACRRVGATECAAAGNATQCSVQPGAPVAEICNSADDDCDGRVDEGACPDLVPPTVVLNVDPLAAAVGEAVHIHATAADDRGNAALTVTVAGQPVVLDANGDGTFFPPAEGNYPVLARAVDDAGNAAQAQAVVVAVEARPTAVVQVNPPRLARGDNRATVVTLDGSASFGGAGLVFTWTIPDAQVVGGGLDQAIVRVTLPGDHDQPWTLRVENALGQDVAQGAVRINSRPLADIDAPVALPVGSELALDGTQSSDPEGDLLQFAWRVIEAPVGSAAGLQGAAADVATFVPDLGGIYRFELVVGDGLEESDPAIRAVVATSPDRTPPVVAIQLSANPVAPGAQVTLTVQANDAGGITSRQLFIDGAPVALDGANQARFAPPVEGRYALRALATDRAGNLGGVDSALFAATLADNGAPTVAITAPTDGTVVNGLFDVRGTVTDADLAVYLIELSPRGANTWTTVFEGDQPVNNGLLGQVDPSALAEGLYDLRLRAFDDRGNSRSTSIIVEVPAGVAFGRMRRVFLDARTPLVGIPIEIRRIYDSGRKAPGDFGVAWSLDIGAGRYEETRPVAEGWTWNGRCVPVFGPPGAVTETDKHIITIIIGDQAYRFFPVVTFTACGGGFQEGEVEYRRFPGTSATLTPTHSTTVWHIGGELIDIDTFDLWEPGLLELALPDGRRVLYDPDTGVKRVDDDAGHTLTIDAQGVHHSSGASIDLVRDAQGRITTVRLPDGSQRTYTYDGRGDLVESVDFIGGETFYRYDFDHNLLRIVDARGNVPLAMEYDASGRLVAYVDANGNRIEVGHDGAARQEVITDRLGNRTIYHYDARGNVIEIINALGERTEFTYNALNKILTQTDALGHVIQHTYDANGNRTETVDANGEHWLWTYDAEGHVLTEVDPEGNTITNVYDAAGNKTRVTDAAGAVTQWAFDAAGNNTRVTDPVGNVQQFSFTNTGYVSQIVGPTGAVTTLTNNGSGELTRSVHTRQTLNGPEQVEWSYGYDRDGELRSVVGPGGARAAFLRDDTGLVVGATDPSGQDVQLTVDSFGQIRERRGPTGETLRVEYDVEGNQTATVVPGGARFERTYDPLNRLAAVLQPEGGSVTQAYDAAGRVIRRTTALGASVDYSYDAAGQIMSITAPGNAVTTYERDAAGRLTGLTDAAGATWAFELDGAGRVTRTLYPDGRQEQKTYDGNGKPLTLTSPGGAQWHFVWSATGDLDQVTDPLGQVTRYLHDSQGQLSQVTDALGRITGFLTGPTGQLLERRLPEGGVDRFTYDVGGRPIDRTEPSGRVTRYTHDDAGRLARTELPDGAEVRRTRDGAGNEIRIEEARGVTTIARDGRGRIVRLETPARDVLTRVYDLDGRISETTTGAGTAHYTYNGRSELVGIEDPDGRLYGLNRDLVGRTTLVSLPDGSTLARTYDPLGRPTRITHRNANASLRQQLVYVHDNAGRVARITEDDGRVVDYTYDALDRLTEERTTVPGEAVETIQYTYDAVGNVIRRVDGAGARDFAYDRNDRLLDDDRFTYTWDPDGRLIGREGAGVQDVLRYDGLGRLSVVERQGQADIRYFYDYDGLLALREEGAQRQRFIWDRAGGLPVLMEIRDDSDDSLITRYVYGGDTVIAQVHGDGRLETLTTDHLGSVRAVGGNGATTRVRYEGYGAPTAGAPDGLGYIGAWTDPSTGLLFLRARWFSPETTRFITADLGAGDPLDPRTINRYAYSGGDPINKADPSGNEFSLAGLSVALTIVGILANIAFAIYPSALEAIFAGFGVFSIFRFTNQTAVVFPFASLAANRGIVGAVFGLELLRFNTGIWALYFYFGVSLSAGVSKGISGSLNAAIGVVFDTPGPSNYTGWFISITTSGAKLFSALSRRIKNFPAIIRAEQSCSAFWSPTPTFEEADGTDRFSHGYSCTARSIGFGGSSAVGNSISLAFTYYLKLLELGHEPGDEYKNFDPGF